MKGVGLTAQGIGMCCCFACLLLSVSWLAGSVSPLPVSDSSSPSKGAHTAADTEANSNPFYSLEVLGFPAVPTVWLGSPWLPAFDTFEVAVLVQFRAVWFEAGVVSTRNKESGG